MSENRRGDFFLSHTVEIDTSHSVNPV